MPFVITETQIVEVCSIVEKGAVHIGLTISTIYGMYRLITADTRKEGKKIQKEIKAEVKAVEAAAIPLEKVVHHAVVNTTHTTKANR